MNIEPLELCRLFFYAGVSLSSAFIVGLVVGMIIMFILKRH